MLRVSYELADLEPGQIVDLRERRGSITIRVERTATLEEFVGVMNEVSAELLDGAQWFQLWKGEIVSMDSPEDPRGRGTVARLHRGPLVQEGARRPGHGQAHAG